MQRNQIYPDIRNVITLGITGGIGSGKSTVCRMLESLGIPVFYADDEARRLYDEPNIRSQIIREFGADVYSGTIINRKEMANRVFNDPEKLKKLEAILHPALAVKYESWRAQRAHLPCTAKEAAILIESGAYQQCDKVILVTAPEVIRVERVVRRDNSSEAEVRLRMKKQWNDELKRAYADLEIINDGIAPVLEPLLNFLESTGCIRKSDR